MSFSKNDAASEYYISLKDIAFRWGACLFGVADLSDASLETYLLEKVAVDGLIYGISMGIRVSQRIVSDIGDHPTRLYFYHYRRINIALDQLAIAITNQIQNAGLDALPIPSSQTVDWENQRGHISHKDIGVKAGLGWIGRNNLLVNPEFGSIVRYVTVLTNMPLKTDEPLKEGCGGCSKCVNVCPAGAIKESSSDFEHLRCYEKLKEFSKRYHIGHYICGICVRACNGKLKTS